MIDLNKLKAQCRVWKAADFYKAIGAAPDSDFDDISEALEDYCDLDYMALRISGHNAETVSIGKIRNPQFPGFTAVTAPDVDVDEDEPCDDVILAIDDLVYNSGDLYYTLEQIMEQTGASEADVELYLQQVDDRFTEELCLPTDDGKAYRVLTEASVDSLQKALDRCGDAFNTLADKMETAGEGGPVTIAKMFSENAPKVQKILDEVAAAVKAKYGNKWPTKQWVI